MSNQWSYADNRTDAVNQLLIMVSTGRDSTVRIITYRYFWIIIYFELLHIFRLFAFTPDTMVLKSDQQKMQQLLSEAITVLCKNGLNYQSHMNVEALVGITLDDSEVVLVSVRETIQQLNPPQAQLVSPAVPRQTPVKPSSVSRKRPAPQTPKQPDTAEPPAKRFDEGLSAEKPIQIKGEAEEGEDTNDTVEYQEGEGGGTDTGQDLTGDDYGNSQLEQFVDFGTSQTEDFPEDSKAAVFANQSYSQPQPAASNPVISPRQPQQVGNIFEFISHFSLAQSQKIRNDLEQNILFVSLQFY